MISYPTVLAQQASETPADVLNPAAEQARTLWETAVASLPRVGIAAAIGLIALAIGLVLAHVAQRSLDRTNADRVVTGLLARIVRLLIVIGAVLLALAIGGVPLGSVIAFFAVAGVAVGLAIQGILENFIAGVILSFRRPFKAGDQIVTGEFEGTVEGIDLRVTTLRDYDGERILIPNRDVYTNPLVNLTGGGKRRSRVMIGIDYRDDHDEARRVIQTAVASVEGVLVTPAPQVLLTELGDSSVNFEVMYWTTPHIREVRQVQDRVLSAAKSAIDAAGLTIPWPIRTLVPDGVFTTERAS